MLVTRTDKYSCEHCDTEQVFTLFGHNQALLESLMGEALKEDQNLHWYAAHHVCAVCGQLVGGDDYTLVVNDGSIAIHEDYSHHYGIKLKRGDASFCLRVHKACLR